MLSNYLHTPAKWWHALDNVVSFLAHGLVLSMSGVLNGGACAISTPYFSLIPIFCSESCARVWKLNIMSRLRMRKIMLSYLPKPVSFGVIPH